MKETYRYPLFVLDYKRYYELAPDMGQHEIFPYMNSWLETWVENVKLVYSEDSNLSEHDIIEYLCKDLTTFIEINGI